MNKFIFLGRLTKEVEKRVTTTGTDAANFDIAVRRKFNNEQVQADFFRITAFGKTAEFCGKYFEKGKQVLVEGRLQNRTWEDEKGNKRYTTNYIAEQVYFADSSTNKSDGEFVTIAEDEELPF